MFPSLVFSFPTICLKPCTVRWKPDSGKYVINYDTAISSGAQQPMYLQYFKKSWEPRYILPSETHFEGVLVLNRAL